MTAAGLVAGPGVFADETGGASPTDAERVFPFPRSSEERGARRSDKLLSLWADGRRCSIGCRAPGARRGWPLKPFHRQHALRSGFNERRDSSFHYGIDIQAYDGTKVYAVQGGRARTIVADGPEERVQVGNFIYWHVNIRVPNGKRVRPFETVVGTIKRGHGHLHLSEVDADGRYLNPLRPRGRVVGPWHDTEPPVIGEPEFKPRGGVVLEAFDPQSFRVTTTYETPVLAPGGLAWRLYDRRGRRVGPLQWAYRGTQSLPFYPYDRLIWANGARRPGWLCFATRTICKPTWRYRLAGGLAPRLRRRMLRRKRLRLSVYAWDWADNITARDFKFGRRRGEFVPRRASSSARGSGRVQLEHAEALPSPAPSPRATAADRG